MNKAGSGSAIHQRGRSINQINTWLDPLFPTDWTMVHYLGVQNHGFSQRLNSLFASYS